MGGVSQRHRMVLEELTKWWEDLCSRGIGPQAVLVEVPAGWGRSTLLDRFAGIIGRDDAPVTLVVPIQARLLRALPGGPATQVRLLTDLLAAASVKFPVVVLIDDLDVLGPDLALVLAENLITRPDGQVLLVAVTVPIPPGPGREAGPGAELAPGPGWPGGCTAPMLTQTWAPSRGRSWQRSCTRGLSAAAVRRIGRRTATLAEVFKVCAEQRISDAGQADNSAAAVAIVDEAIDVALAGYPVSALEKILAWAGGTVHARQAQAASATAELADAASAWGRVGAVIV